MKFKSQVYTQASGSIGGITYSHNKGGMYTRGRSIPTDPGSSRQMNVRDSVSMYSQMWTTGLTQAQRDEWELYALNVPVLDTLGDPILISGINHFIRANVPRNAADLQLAPTTPLGSQLNASGIFTLPMLIPPTITSLVASTGVLTVEFAEEDWGDLADNALLIYLGRPRSVGRNFFKGPYRLAAMIQGDAMSAPTTPFASGNLNGVWNMAAGQRVKVRFSLSVNTNPTQPVGLSAPTYDEIIVT